MEEINYNLELTPAQLKITHTALRSLLDDFGHEEQDVIQIIHEVLAKLPDEHAIRAIQIGQPEGEPGAPHLKAAPPSDDEPSPSAA